MKNKNLEEVFKSFRFSALLRQKRTSKLPEQLASRKTSLSLDKIQQLTTSSPNFAERRRTTFAAPLKSVSSNNILPIFNAVKTGLRQEYRSKFPDGRTRVQNHYIRDVLKNLNALEKVARNRGDVYSVKQQNQALKKIDMFLAEAFKRGFFTLSKKSKYLRIYIDNNLVEKNKKDFLDFFSTKENLEDCKRIWRLLQRELQMMYYQINQFKQNVEAKLGFDLDSIENIIAAYNRKDIDEDSKKIIYRFFEALFENLGLSPAAFEKCII